MGTKLGAIKRWAKKLGITTEEYLKYLENGLKRCTKCKQWKPQTDFPKDSSRGDGLNTKCHACIKVPEPRKPHMPEWAKEALRDRNRKNRWRKGIALPKIQREYLRQISIEQKRFCGPTNPNWKGGVTSENQILRNNSEYHQWREKIYKRDNYTCQYCGDNSGGNLQGHHIKSWPDYPHLRYDVDNGLTVCESCHELIHDQPNSIRKRAKARKASMKQRHKKL